MAAKQEKEDRQQRQAGSYMLIARLLASQRERDTMQHTHDSFDGALCARRAGASKSFA